MTSYAENIMDIEEVQRRAGIAKKEIPAHTVNVRVRTAMREIGKVQKALREDQPTTRNEFQLRQLQRAMDSLSELVD